ncbi:MAG: 23S rRNA (pseudouridine(1915)-N(3))-methyltransferase RlmH [Lachnospiraceae bacterium]|nr:23S rRNA (pseudouridine(1915)-N(3))-methyltransferase RlmH [Lachnospiraceae bacterium]
MKLIVVGKLKEDYLKNKAFEYERLIEKKNKIKVIELLDESIPKNAKESINGIVKEKEGDKILEQIKNTDYVIALCIDGKVTTSEKLREIVNKGKSKTNGDVVFVIGGSLGLDDRVVKRANEKISFSKMTFPHQLMRIMLLEQMATYL